MSGGRVDLRQIFLGLQAEMADRLGGLREISEHPGVKGDAAELNWQNMLSDYLPWRYRVSKAFVLDAQGEISDQIDLVIYDRQYSPFLFNQDGCLYVPAESVYGVFEVKPALDRRVVLYAGQKAGSVRRLKRTSAPIAHAGGTYEPRPLFPIVAGVLCLDSGWSPCFGAPFEACLCELGAERRLDLGCVLNDGAFEVTYESSEGVKVRVSDRESALIFFFLRLLTRFQQLGTAPAIDFNEYSKVLEGKSGT